MELSDGTHEDYHARSETRSPNRFLCPHCGHPHGAISGGPPTYGGTRERPVVGACAGCRTPIAIWTEVVTTYVARPVTTEQRERWQTGKR